MSNFLKDQKRLSDQDSKRYEYIQGEDQLIFVDSVAIEKDYETGDPYANVLFRTSRLDEKNKYPGAAIVNRPYTDLNNGQSKLSHGQRLSLDEFNKLSKNIGYDPLTRQDGLTAAKDGGLIYKYEDRAANNEAALAFRGNVVRDRTLTDREQADVPNYKAGYVQVSSLRFDPDYDPVAEQQADQAAVEAMYGAEQQNEAQATSPSKGPEQSGPGV